MKAIGFSKYLPPYGLEQREVPIPEPKQDQVLIRVHASSINSWDWEFLNGKPFVNRLMFGLLRPRASKQILGADVAGTVERVGNKVTRFRPGDAVFGDLWDSWGGFAQYACAPESALELKPVNATFEEAAAIPQAGVLALQGLRKGAPLGQGKRVLINGAGGGVGTIAVQLAKHSGAEVTGVDAPHKLDAIRSLGVDYVIDYTRENFARTGNTYDLVVDCLSSRAMSEIKGALRPGGTYAMVGGTGVLRLLAFNGYGSLTGECRSYYLVDEGPNKGLGELKELIEEGVFKPVVDRIYPLAEVPSALHYFGQGRHKGKIVISVDISSTVAKGAGQAVA